MLHLGFYTCKSLLPLSGLVKLCKVLGTLNPAGILTKDVSKDVLSRHLSTLGLTPRQLSVAYFALFCTGFAKVILTL
jgi:hypothetical protein